MPPAIANKKLPGDAASWIVLATQPHRETLASENLLRQDYNVYCPMLAKRIRHARRAYDALRPLFPGYLFVERNECIVERPINGTYGVRSILRNGETPALLPASFIGSLKAREAGGVIGKGDATLKSGQAVTIDGGPFDGLAGKIIEVRESDRVLLLLDLVYARTKFNIDASMVRPFSSAL